MFMRGGCSDGPVAVNNVRRGRSRWFHTNIKSIPDRQLADEMRLTMKETSSFDIKKSVRWGTGGFVYRSLAAFPETKEGGGGGDELLCQV